MITSYASPDTAALAHGAGFRGLPRELVRAAQRKLAMIDALSDISDLLAISIVPQEVDSTERSDLYHLGVSGRWHLRFRFDGHDAHQVEMAETPAAPQERTHAAR